MSNKLINLVYENESGNLTITENSLLAALADISADDGTSIFPSYDKMAKKIKSSRDTVIVTIKSLCQKGYLAKKPRFAHGRQTSNNYYINVQKLWQEADKSEPTQDEINPFNDESESEARGRNFLPPQSEFPTPPVGNSYPNPPLTPLLSYKENIKRKKPLTSLAVSSSKDNKNDFEKFYEEYPVKKEPAAAARAFEKAIKKTDIDTLLIALREQKKAREEALKGGHKVFIPNWKHPATWLNKGCWLDETTYEVSSSPPSKQQKFDEGMDVFDAMSKSLDERRRRAGLIPQSPELTYYQPNLLGGVV